jgi:diguanylate cyclase (GGDEF)-like protein/PAS domain S-box-containing protein
MSGRHFRSTRRRTLLTTADAVAVLAAYLALAWVGDVAGTLDGVAVFYPPAGLAIVVAVLAGWRVVPLLALGELLAGELLLDLHDDLGRLQLLVLAVGYAVVWGGGAALIRREMSTRRRLVDQVLLAVGIGAGLTPLVAAAYGEVVRRWAGVDPETFVDALVARWGVEAVGVAAVAPTILVVRRWLTTREERPFGGTNPVVAAVQLASPLAVAAVVFGASDEVLRAPYLVVLPVVLVALRFGLDGAAIGTVGLAPLITALAGDLYRAGGVEPGEIQALLLVAIGTGLAVGIVVSERERLGRLHRELSEVIESTPDLVSIVDADGRLRYVNPAARAAAGLAPDVDLRDLRDVDLVADPISAASTEHARIAAQQDGSWSGDVSLHFGDGRELSGSKVVLVHHDREGNRPRTTSIVRDMTDQRRRELQLGRRALYDSATRLPTRALLADRLDHARRRGREPVLLVVVVDGLSDIVTALGSRAGDAVLREVARRLVERLEPADTVARVGPDAFAVLTDHDLDEVGACTLGDRLISEVRGQFDIASRPITVAVGIGVASDESIDDGDDLVRAAEATARRALELGGVRAVAYPSRASKAPRRSVDVEIDLREAIDHGRWWLDYQPIVDLASGQVVSCEALLRWSDQAGDPVPPGELIGLAEATGLIVPLGRSVLERACLDTLGWANRGERVTVAVNVSARQLNEPGFTRSFAEVLHRTGVSPGLVTVEVSEPAFSGDPAKLRSLLDDLRALGVEVAMDDFGTGSSSLAHLGGLPLTKVKLDKTFIDDLATSSRCRHLVQGVITLAHALGLIVIAEGVEHEAQVAILRELGCDRAQGYLFSHPLPPEDLRESFEPEPPPDDLDPVTRGRLDRYG